MHVEINFKKPGSGMYKMILTYGQKLQFYRGRARRIPKDSETVFNTIPTKYITRIEIPEKEPMTVEQIRKEMKKRTDSERCEIMDSFCKHCGSLDNRCQCWNDD